MRVVFWLFECAMPLLFGLGLALLALYPFQPDWVAQAAPWLAWSTAGLFLIYGVVAWVALLALLARRL
jgi:hypothetical protein